MYDNLWLLLSLLHLNYVYHQWWPVIWHFLILILDTKYKFLYLPLLRHTHVHNGTGRNELCVGIGPNNWIFQGFPNISFDGVLFGSFDPLNFFTGTNILHTIISCVYIHFSITSQASGRTTSHVIIPTIIFFFLSTLLYKVYPWALQIFNSFYFYSGLSLKVVIPRNGSVSTAVCFGESRSGYCHRLVSSVMRFGERILIVVIFVANVNNVYPPPRRRNNGLSNIRGLDAVTKT